MPFPSLSSNHTHQLTSFDDTVMDTPTAICNYGSTGSSSSSGASIDGKKGTKFASPLCDSGSVDGIGVVNNSENLEFTSATTNNSESNRVYEEFFGGTMVCPTCDGKGRISRESENELVALIPVRDKRLKPRRTWLYVGAAIASCLMIGGLLLFFFFPRNVIMSSDIRHIIPDSISTNTTSPAYLILSIKNGFNFTNQNYVSVAVTSMQVHGFFDNHIVGDATNTTELHIYPRVTTQHFIFMNLTFSGEEGYIALYCNDKRTHGHSLLIPFEVTAHYTCMGRDETMTLNTFQHVRCTDNET